MKPFLINILFRLTAVLMGIFFAPLFLICCLGVIVSNRRPTFVRLTDNQNRLTGVHFNLPCRGGLARFCRENQLHLLPEMWFSAAGPLRLPMVLRHMMEPARSRS